MSEEKEKVQIDQASPVQANEEGEDAIKEKKLLRKIDWHVVPALAILFFLSFNGNSLSVPCFAFSSPAFSRICPYRWSRRGYTHKCVSLPVSMISTPHPCSKRKPRTSSSPHYPSTSSATSCVESRATSLSGSRLHGSGFPLSPSRGVSFAPFWASPETSPDC